MSAANTPYIVSARKYRPATFASVVGQDNLTNTLRNAIDSHRLAQAYLFTGPRGVGKTSCARIFAKTINCLSPTAEGEACGHCESCRAIEEGNSFNIIELDAASNNSVDDIRALTEQVAVPPQTGRYRVFIIDEVHMLTTQAFNAFLKTLEEPPSYVIFILATTEKHKVIPTILSRCQIYDFKRITVDDMAAHLARVAASEGIEAQPEALNVIARKADGAMRDALSIFDQVAASTMGHMTYEATIANLNVLDYEFYFKLVEAFRTGDVAGALVLYKEIRDKGFDSLFFVNGLAAHVRDLMVAADTRTLGLLEVAHDVAQRYAVQAAQLPLPWYYAALKLLSDCDLNYRTASDKRLLVELTLIKLCQLLNPSPPPFNAPDTPVKLEAIPPQGAAPAQPQVAAAPAVRPQAASPASAAPTEVPAEAAVQAPMQRSGTVKAGKPRQPQATAQTGQGTGRPTTIRLSQAMGQINTTVSEERTEPFTRESLNTAWNKFSAVHPELQILANAMRAARPEPGPTPTEWRVTVSHPAQQQAFESAMSTLLPFLRDQLRNDLLTLSVQIAEAPAVEKHLAPQEFIKKVVAENKAAADFLAAIDAELV